MDWQMLLFILLTAAPFTELRLGIPAALATGMDPWFVIPFAIILNCLIFFPIYFCLNVLYERFFSRFSWARRIVDRAQRKGKPFIEKYGVVGLALYIGIPLPVTGVWTGTLIAWIFGLDWKRSFLAVCAGVLIAATIISAVVLGVIGGLNFILA
jgi:uncharacterized membrane protein